MQGNGPKGFTVLEVLITIAIAGILVATTLPAFKAFLQQRTLQTAGIDVHAALRYARGAAISRNVPVTFCAGAPTRGCVGDWQSGQWMAFLDPDRDGGLAQPSDVLDTGHFHVDRALSISANGPLSDRTVFLPQGHSEHPSGAFGAGRVRLCHEELDESNVVEVILSAGGRARSERLSLDGTCPEL